MLIRSVTELNRALTTVLVCEQKPYISCMIFSRIFMLAGISVNMQALDSCKGTFHARQRYNYTPRIHIVSRLLKTLHSPKPYCFALSCPALLRMLAGCNSTLSVHSFEAKKRGFMATFRPELLFHSELHSISLVFFAHSFVVN